MAASLPETEVQFKPTHTYVKDLHQKPRKYLGKEITIKGWVKSARVQKGLAFVLLSDHTHAEPFQIVFHEEITEQVKEVAKTGACLGVTGEIVKSPGNMEIELVGTEFTVYGQIEDPGSYPIAKKKLTLEHLRQFPHLRVRTNTHGSVTRIRSGMMFATHQFFRDLGFSWVNTPIISGSDCEGAGEVFRVTTLLGDGSAESVQQIPTLEDGTLDNHEDFFKRQAYLTVSGQLQGESYACGMTHVYTFGPTFRSENSHTSRHLAEFWMIEPEVAFIELPELMDLAESYLVYCIRFALEEHHTDLESLEKFVSPGLIERLEQLIAEPFARVTYTEAIELLMDSGQEFEIPVEWGIDMGSEHEKYLTDVIFGKPVIVTNYPAAIKAFYMKLDPHVDDDRQTVQGMDILLPGIGEVIGGSIREDQYDVLVEKMERAGVSREPLEWYLDLRKFGSCPHGGFGLGFERLLMLVTGLQNIRDVIPYPRWPGHCDC